jgi:hypothetical protein
VQKRPDLLRAWLVIDRRRGDQRATLSNDAVDAPDFNMPLASSTGLPHLQAREASVAPTDPDVFHVPECAAAVLDQIYDHEPLQESRERAGLSQATYFKQRAQPQQR